MGVGGKNRKPTLKKLAVGPIDHPSPNYCWTNKRDKARLPNSNPVLFPNPQSPAQAAQKPRLGLAAVRAKLGARLWPSHHRLKPLRTQKQPVGVAGQFLEIPLPVERLGGVVE